MNVFSLLNSKSIKGRFISTLVANIIRFTLSFFSGMIIARALGPADFGNFNFLLASFTSIAQLLDMGSSTAFYTFISRKKRGSSFYRYYMLWMALQFIMALIIATVLLPDVLRQKIWLGHGRSIVVLSMFASFGMNQLWQVVSQAGESIRETVTVQAFNILLSVAYILGILLIGRLGILSVPSLFVFITVEYAIFAFFLARRLKGEFVDNGRAESLRDVLGEFKTYCYPLVGFSIVGFAYAFADNWLLQRFAGPTEQGFYAIGYRFTFLSSIAMASMLQVLWKEIAEAMERRDTDRVRELFFRTSRVIYFSTAVFSCFLIPFSKEVLVWLVGPSYEGAWLCMSIMLFYPLIQAIGQVSQTVLLAAGKTVLYRNYGIAFMLLCIPASYLILATPEGEYLGIPGLGLGATGLALKVVVLNFIGTNVIVYIVSRLYKWKFDFLYQVETGFLLLFAAYASKYSVSWLLGTLLTTVSTPTLFLGSVLIYLTTVAAFVYAFPTLTGLEKGELKSMYESVKSSIEGQGG